MRTTDFECRGASRITAFTANAGDRLVIETRGVEVGGMVISIR